MIDQATTSRGPETSEERRVAARLLASSILDRRAGGELVADEQVVQLHPELVPELLEELAAAAAIRAAYLAAGKCTPALPLMTILSEAELEAPIEEFDSPADGHEALAVVPPQLSGYAVIREISRGGQGAVFQAVQESTGQQVAIKVMPGGSFLSSRHRARFDREATILAQVRHPNIVSIIDRGRTADGTYYLVMEYIDGPEFDRYWTDQVPKGIAGTRQLLQAFVKVGRAIEDAHARGIIHRDLKPSNIRVDAHGEPHVLDFGLASDQDGLASPITQSGQIIGSLPWTSPEQAAGAPASPSSDVYALGVMLYQSIAGRFPYPVTGPIRDVLENIAHKVATPILKVPGSRAALPGCNAIVQKALAKSPHDRYSSSGELANDIERVLFGRRPIARARHRQRWWATALLLAVTAAAALPLASKLRSTPEVPRPPSVVQLPSLTNSLRMKLVELPAGKFMMGSPATETGRDTWESRYLASIDRPFWIGVTEVTQLQYGALMTDNPTDIRWRGPDLPVSRVTWDEATEFCRRLSEAEHRHYRLPTEAEWEYACRAGDFDTGTAALIQSDWFARNSGGALHAVGTKWPNAFGLYDVHGNVAEWCASAGAETAGNPPLAWTSRIVKGGSAFADTSRCRSAYRQILPPKTRLNELGFRVVLDSLTPGQAADRK